MVLMLDFEREEIKESLAGGDLIRLRLPVPDHLVGKPVSSLDLAGKILVVGVDRGGTGFIPVPESTFQEGDHAALVVHKDSIEALDEHLTPTKEH